VDDERAWFCLRPGGGGYDMMNGCTLIALLDVKTYLAPVGRSDDAPLLSEV